MLFPICSFLFFLIRAACFYFIFFNETEILDEGSSGSGDDADGSDDEDDDEGDEEAEAGDGIY